MLVLRLSAPGSCLCMRWLEQSDTSSVLDFPYCNLFPVNMPARSFDVSTETSLLCELFLTIAAFHRVWIVESSDPNHNNLNITMRNTWCRQWLIWGCILDGPHLSQDLSWDPLGSVLAQTSDLSRAPCSGQWNLSPGLRRFKPAFKGLSGADLLWTFLSGCSPVKTISHMGYTSRGGKGL